MNASDTRRLTTGVSPRTQAGGNWGDVRRQEGLGLGRGSRITTAVSDDRRAA